MKDHFKTADLILAATILATLDVHLIGVDRSNPKDVKFVFKRDDISDEFVEAFGRGDLRIEPVGFMMVLCFVVNKVRREG